MLRDMLLKHAVRNRFGEVIYFGGRNEVKRGESAAGEKSRLFGGQYWPARGPDFHKQHLVCGKDSGTHRTNTVHNSNPGRDKDQSQIQSDQSQIINLTYQTATVHYHAPALLGLAWTCPVTMRTLWQLAGQSAGLQAW
jgi:hypothetical protein